MDWKGVKIKQERRGTEWEKQRGKGGKEEKKENKNISY